VSSSRRRSEAVQRTAATAGAPSSWDKSTRRNKIEYPGFWTPTKTGQSVRSPTVNSQPLDNMFRVVTAVQKIMTEIKGAVSEEEK
jgi:hypothetical protein